MRTFYPTILHVLLLGLVGAGPLAADVKTPGLPMTGKAVPALAAFDQAMQQFMKERRILAGSLAICQDGNLVLARGYGFADRRKTRKVMPDTPFRIASLSKSFTAAAIRKLVRDGKITMDTKAFQFLGIQPPVGKKLDPRCQKITIQHLLEHRGGWDQQKAGDPFFRTLAIASSLKKKSPVSARDVIHYMAGQRLQFEPGSKSQYSNLGYAILGRVIERTSRQTYLGYLKQEMLKPLGLQSVEVARTLLGNRNPKEPRYIDPELGRNVFRPQRRQFVSAPDGGFPIETFDAHAGLIASVSDLARFLGAYWLEGTPRAADQRGTYCHFGSLPGTFTMGLQRLDGINIAVLFNQRKDASRLPYETIQGVMNKAADGVKTWPKE